MPYFVGLDTSKKTTSVCVIDAAGVVVREGVVETSPPAIIGFLRGEGRRYARVGMEAWSIAPWLYAGLAKGRLPIFCIEVHHAHGILKTRRNKSDRNDARGIAEMMRVGAFRQVHVKSDWSREVRAMLVARTALVTKAGDLANLIGGTLLTFGLKLGRLQRRTFERRALALTEQNPAARAVVAPLLRARAALIEERNAIESRLLAIAQSDPVCRRLMTAPYVGPLTALLYKTAIDEPGRFGRSRNVGAHLGLTPRLHQSGEISTLGRVTRAGDAAVRTALFIAAIGQLKTNVRPNWLRAWALDLAERRGRKKAAVALARRLAIVLHRMWISETDFRWEGPAAPAA